MQKVKIVLGGFLILAGIVMAISILPAMLEAQKERRAQLKSQLLEYSLLKQNK